MGYEWLAPTGFLLALASLYLTLRLRWAESLFLAVASVFVTLWGLHDSVYYSAPSFYQLVAGAAFVLNALAVILAVVTGLVLKKLVRVRGLP